MEFPKISIFLGMKKKSYVDQEFCDSQVGVLILKKNDQTDDEDKQNRGSSAVHIGFWIKCLPCQKWL